MSTSTQTNDIAGELRKAWHGFVDAVVPLRPQLHAYCRKLTGNLCDAEDLAQETLLRAFAQWGVTHPPIQDPRAYMLRTATNVWIDWVRRRSTEAGAPADAAPGTVPASSVEVTSHVRDGAAHLVRHLSPQEGAALVLKEAFDMPLDEIATLLATSTGAVKAALHRARDRLESARQEGAHWHRPRASRALIERFIDRFAARDVDGLIALMHKGASADNVGNSFHLGNEPEGLTEFFTKVVHGHSEWPEETRYEPARLQFVEFEGEPVLLMLVTRKGKEELMTVIRLEEQDGKISRVRAYGFCPDTIRAVGENLGMRVFTELYRAPEPIAP